MALIKIVVGFTEPARKSRGLLLPCKDARCLRNASILQNRRSTFPPFVLPSARGWSPNFGKAQKAMPHLGLQVRFPRGWLKITHSTPKWQKRAIVSLCLSWTAWYRWPSFRYIHSFPRSCQCHQRPFFASDITIAILHNWHCIPEILMVILADLCPILRMVIQPKSLSLPSSSSYTPWAWNSLSQGNSISAVRFIFFNVTAFAVSRALPAFGKHRTPL